MSDNPTNKPEEILRRLYELRSTICDEDEAALETNRQQIVETVTKHRDELTFEVLFESLTTIGYAPALVFDDDGNFAVTCAGFSTVNTRYSADDRDDETVITTDIGSGRWRPTVRDALYVMLDEVAESVLGLKDDDDQPSS